MMEQQEHTMTEGVVIGTNEYTAGRQIVCSCGYKGPERGFYQNDLYSALERDRMLHWLDAERRKA